jgi:hypothetical protein
VELVGLVVGAEYRLVEYAVFNVSGFHIVFTVSAVVWPYVSSLVQHTASGTVIRPIASVLFYWSGS